MVKYHMLIIPFCGFCY